MAEDDALLCECEALAPDAVQRVSPTAEEVTTAGTVVLDAVLGRPRAPRLPTDAVVLVLEPHGHHRNDPWRPLDVQAVLARAGDLGVGIEQGSLAGGYIRLVGRVGARTAPAVVEDLLGSERSALFTEQARVVTLEAESAAVKRSLTAQRTAAKAEIDALRARLAAQTVPLVAPEQRRIEELEAELERTRARADRHATRADVFAERVAAWQGRVERMEARRWWQLGELLGRARRSPLRLLRLPLDILLLLAGRGAAAAPSSDVSSAGVATVDDPADLAAEAEPAEPTGPSVVPELAPGSIDGDWVVPDAAVPPRPQPPAIPRVPLPAVRPRRDDVRVAAVLDPFSELAFGHEVALEQLSRGGWREELERSSPDLLLVESAWRGKDGLWLRGVGSPAGQPSDDLRELVAAARAAGIPTVFWNKEDPPNYDVFAGAAALFDRVYTVDEDCVERYAEVLGGDRVGVLPFAAQPAIHDPIAVRGGRAHDVAFAGTYFPVKHPVRREQMAAILEPAREFGLHIFSRNEDDPRHRFPAPLDEHVVGSLPYEDMLTAYKRYKVFLNVNSVVGSRTTCSRRIFELLASGTPVVSGSSPAIEHLLGPDLVLQSDSPDRTRQHLKLLLGSDEVRDRIASRGLRAVHGGHTYRHRVQTVLGDLGLRTGARSPRVSVVAATMRPENLDTLCANLRRQTYPDIQVVLVTHGWEIATSDVERRLEGGNVQDLQVIAAPRTETLGAITSRGLDVSDGDYIAKFDDDDHYGPNYLTDQLAAFEYTDAELVGKRALYCYLESMDATVLRSPGREHQYVPLVAGPTMVAPRDVWAQLRFPDLPRGMDTEAQRRAVEQGMRIYATDRFNFCFRRRATGHTWDVAEEDLAAAGRVVFYGWNPAHVEA